MYVRDSGFVFYLHKNADITTTKLVWSEALCALNLNRWAIPCHPLMDQIASGGANVSHLIKFYLDYLLTDLTDCALFFVGMSWSLTERCVNSGAHGKHREIIRRKAFRLRSYAQIEVR